MAQPSVIERLRRELALAGLTAFVHYQTNRPCTVFEYLSAVPGLEDSGLVIPADADAVLVSKEFEEARARTGRISDVRPATTIPVSKAMEALGEVFREKHLLGKKVGVDETELTLEVYLHLKKLGLEPVPFSEVIRKLRARKTAEEIVHMREAVRLATLAQRRVQSLAGEGLTEAELAAEAGFAMERNGGEKSFVGVQFGRNASLPHWRPSATRVAGNGLLVVDLGAKASGYNSDLTRTFRVGEPSAQEEKMLQITNEAVLSAISEVKPGVSLSRAAASARRVIREAGLPEPKHRIGHGVGLSVHEYPVVEEGFDTVAEGGMVFTIEPGVYIDGRAGCRTEVEVLVTDSGPEVLDRGLEL